MKKAYKKPQIYFESFQLSASIAATCRLIITVNGNMCPVTDPDLGITYYADTNMCRYKPAPGDIKICYDTNAVDNNQVFSSI